MTKDYLATTTELLLSKVACSVCFDFGVEDG